MALDPMVRDRLGNEQRWVLNPFRFFRKALGTPATAPAPDVTTVNGRRMLMAHIDGDGFMNRARLPGTPFAAKVILNRILKRFPIPHTVSIIEGEIGPKGLHPKESPQLERIARRIYRLPNVEPATHTFSHPFAWQRIKPGEPSGKYNLPIPHYRFDLAREITGSVHFINRNLLPPGKHTKVLLWSGDALPGKKALSMAHRDGLVTMNGGFTTITRDRPTLTLVAPLGRPVGNSFQVYAPIMNEELYTNNWHGPYYGFRHVRETYAMTGRPRRLKPIDIYYHFYSGTRRASLRALKSLYRWALSRPVFPLYVSEFVPMVHAFRHVRLARTPRGAWRIYHPPALHTLRLPYGAGYPDLARSRGIAGFRDGPDGRYLHLTGRSEVTLHLAAHRPREPYLSRSNAFLKSWRRTPDGVRFRMRGHRPVVMEWGGPVAGCRVRWKGKTLPLKPTSGGQGRVRFPTRAPGPARLLCDHAP